MQIVRMAPLACMLAATPVWAQDFVKERLENSPRHLEWEKVERDGRTVECFTAYPEVENKTPVVVVIHEIFGLSDWVRSVADQLAEAGYIAVAPDLLSGMAPGGGGTRDFSSGDQVRRAISGLRPEQITADLDAVVEYASKLPASNGTVVVAGFCWGGGQCFEFVANNPKVKAGFVFYGRSPSDPEALERISCPVYGFYGERDERINATIPQTTERMKKAGKVYESVIYAGAGHGFLRAGEAPDASPENKKARLDAWERWKGILKGL